MKKFYLILTLLLLGLSSFAATKNEGGVPKDKLFALVREYKPNEGFHVIKLGSLATSLARTAAKIAIKVDGDEASAEALKMISGVKKVAVVEYEDCTVAVRDSFNAKLKKLLRGYDLLMEVKDDGDQVFMYGIVDENASTVKDFVIYVPEDSALICMFGSISVDAVAKLVEMN